MIPAAWPDADHESSLVIVKQSPAGDTVAEYPARLLPDGAPAPWIVVEAVWTLNAVEVAGLWFRPGDRLLEYFSPITWFNVFAVYAPDGDLRGWYANVTRPVTYDGASNPPRLTWRDLFVDVVMLADRTITVLDEDELAASSLEQNDPETHARVLLTRDHLVDLARAGRFPFVEAGLGSPMVLTAKLMHPGKHD